ncbi:hypothetical protein QO034_15145 [Sedimentitalea sp. JM2-8]|uniref:Sulphur transport domain-containing protein n=1 Tax=Sedimentitalea xiamensis TaxID=3050037 RepID=A0ABT7FHH3_9RHOB|nr:DUF6691 family protein [Sedimentitalea xiamensis]MDK3074435.1 hypothetical protein [Sedimentitalea xiamensis]
MRILLSLLSGSLFGAGLFVSGMTDTRKVQGWLDVFGDWDPTLAFVMGGAIIPMFFAWRLTAGRTPLAGGAFPELPRPELDHRLIIGSVLFGVGWGLAGLCPGPSVASLSYGGAGGLVFMASMLVGMGAAPTIAQHLDRLATPA